MIQRIIQEIKSQLLRVVEFSFDNPDKSGDASFREQYLGLKEPLRSLFT